MPIPYKIWVAWKPGLPPTNTSKCGISMILPRAFPTIYAFKMRLNFKNTNRQCLDPRNSFVSNKIFTCPHSPPVGLTLSAIRYSVIGMWCYIISPSCHVYFSMTVRLQRVIN